MKRKVKINFIFLFMMLVISLSAPRVIVGEELAMGKKRSIEEERYRRWLIEEKEIIEGVNKAVGGYRTIGGKKFRNVKPECELKLCKDRLPQLHLIFKPGITEQEIEEINKKHKLRIFHKLRERPDKTVLCKSIILDQRKPEEIIEELTSEERIEKAKKNFDHYYYYFVEKTGEPNPYFYYPEKILVVRFFYEVTESEEEIKRFANEYELEIREYPILGPGAKEHRTAGSYLFEILSDKTTIEVENEIFGDPRVNSVWVDAILPGRCLDYVPNDEYFDSEWHLSNISAPYAWNHETDLLGMMYIAIVDAGVMINHSDLSDKIEYPVDFWASPPDNDPEDLVNHGTMEQ
ncbi:MAG: hypothetical protein AB1393_11680 [Candidatus Edwardsbacteria bacterium]